MVKLADVDDLTVKELQAELKKLDLYAGKSKFKKPELQKELKKALRAKKRKTSTKSKRKTSTKSKRKSPSTKRRGSTGKNTPESPASDFKVGTVDLGRDDKEYEVAKRSNGVKYWRSCDVQTASCEGENISVGSSSGYTKSQLEAMNVKALNDILTPEAKEIAKAKASTRKAGARPNKAEKISSILQLQRRSQKGKERVVETADVVIDTPVQKVEEKVVVEEPVPEVEEPVPEVEEDFTIRLNGWTVVGELDTARLFLRSIDLATLREKLNSESKSGLARLEPDPDCAKNCGDRIFCLNAAPGTYNLEPRYRGEYLQSLEVGKSENFTKGRADFFLQENLVVGDLDALYRIVNASSDMKKIMADVAASPDVAAFESKRLKKEKQLGVFFRGNAPYKNGFRIGNME